MSKRRRRERKRPRRRRRRRRREPSADLERVFTKVEDLIGRGQAREAVDLLQPKLESHPRVAELHYYLGYARLHAGDLWGAAAGYERAMELSRDPSYWLPLASLYLDLGLRAHALHAFRQLFEYEIDVPMMDDARREVAALEEEILRLADDLGLPTSEMETGLRHMEEGERTLQSSDYPASISANRRAIEKLGSWPPPHNNLALALFFEGQWEEAIATERQVLSHSPKNVQALSNLIRFLAWTGQEPEARKLWKRLQTVEVQESIARIKIARIKKAEAAAVLEYDESVYELLKPLDQMDSALEARFGGAWRAELYLAVAEANTGRRKAAQRRLENLPETVHWASDLLTALKAGRQGLGWSDRFPYFHSSELMPRQAMERLINLVSQEGRMPPQRFRQEVERFLESYPQIVRVAEKLIWEEGQPNAGIGILQIVDTPAAHAALRRFALSQAGNDQVRLQAVSALAEAGQIGEDETLRLWIDGEWREIQLRRQEVTDESDVYYTPEVTDLLNRGQQLFQQNKHEEAERLFERALDLEPQAKEAYNNLAAIYANRDEHERAKEMYRSAIEIDPTYVFPRCNLAMYRLNEGDIEGAKTLLEPLADLARLRPQEMAFYSYIQARVLMYEGEYRAARRLLNTALEVYPGYEPAEDLLEHLDESSEQLELVSRLQKGWESMMEQKHERDRSKRERMQAELSTPDPSLSETLPLYIKNALKGMGRVVMPWGGWTSLRKAELIEELIAALEDRENLERIVDDLNGAEQDALRDVLDRGGSMGWQDFDVRYGNDLEESRHWDWHEPTSVMGRLRLHGLLAEATVDDKLLVVVPTELRQPLEEILQ